MEQLEPVSVTNQSLNTSGPIRSHFQRGGCNVERSIFTDNNINAITVAHNGGTMYFLLIDRICSVGVLVRVRVMMDKPSLLRPHKGD